MQPNSYLPRKPTTHMFKSYWISAWRMLVRNRLYTTINVLGLALGICACLVISLIVRYEFSFDRGHPETSRLYGIHSYVQYMKDEPERLVPGVLSDVPAAIQHDIPGLDIVSPYYTLQHDSAIVVIAGKQYQYPVASVVAGPEYLRLMGYAWLAGNPQTALDRPFSVVLTESRARQYFGTAEYHSIIGKEIIYQDSLRVNVSGIVRDWAGNTDFAYTDFISFATIDHSFLKQQFGLDPNQNSKIHTLVSAFVRLAPNTKADNVQTALTALYHSRGFDKGFFPRIVMQPMRDIHFTGPGVDDSTIRTSQLSTLYTLLSIAMFILVLAIINYVNLATAQSLTREKEIGIRKVMGSSRAHLILQLITETLLLTTVAGLIALAAMRPVLAAFHEFIPERLDIRPFAPDNLLFLLGITVTVTLLAGIYPAKMLSAHSPVSSLKGPGTARDAKWLLRKGLIVFQFTVSLLFIIGTMVIGRQLGFMLHRDLGFRSDAIILFSTGERKDSVSKVKVLQEEIRQLPGVADVSRSNMPPSGMDRGLTTVRYLAKSSDPIHVEMIQADERYLPLYDIRLLAGRNLFPSDTLKEIVINENFSKTLGFKTPAEAIGKRVHTWDKDVTIVGVVVDFHKYSYKEPIRPLLIAGMRCTDLSVRLDTRGASAHDAHAIIARVERQWKTIYPHKPFEFAFFDEELAKFYQREQTMEWLLNIATGITLFISCIGLFGLTLFTTRRRTREIGIRKVMGADLKDILILLGKDFVRLVLIALAIASAGGWYLTHRWLRDYAYRVEVGVDVFLLAGGALMVLTVLTVGLQSLKAATVNPVDSLRSE
jgi:putative ABC transport system permease protein